MKILETRLYQHIDLLVLRYPQLAVTRDCIVEAYRILEEAYTHEGKLLVAGNGGSAADAEHIVGELMKGFVNPRKLETDYSDALITVNKELGRVLSENLQGALPAIALDGHLALTTAYMNDCEPLLCFAQQVNGFGRKSDVFLGISTSGNSKNILYAATVAKAKETKIPRSFRICERCPADGLQRKRETCLEGRFGALFDPPVDVIHVGGNVWKRDF